MKLTEKQVTMVNKLFGSRLILSPRGRDTNIDGSNYMCILYGEINLQVSFGGLHLDEVLPSVFDEEYLIDVVNQRVTQKIESLNNSIGQLLYAKQKINSLDEVEE